MAVIRSCSKGELAGFTAARSGQREDRSGQKRGAQSPADSPSRQRVARSRIRPALPALSGAAGRNEFARLRRSATDHLRLFKDHPEILARWQDRAQHLLVDEYQDTNHVQYLIVQALSAAAESVRGGRRRPVDLPLAGADIRNILDFERDFPGGADLQARSRTTVRPRRFWPRPARHRKQSRAQAKALWTENPDGDLVTYYTGLSERDRSRFYRRAKSAANQRRRVRAGRYRRILPRQRAVTRA